MYRSSCLKISRVQFHSLRNVMKRFLTTLPNHTQTITLKPQSSFSSNNSNKYNPVDIHHYSDYNRSGFERVILDENKTIFTHPESTKPLVTPSSLAYQNLKPQIPEPRLTWYFPKLLYTLVADSCIPYPGAISIAYIAFSTLIQSVATQAISANIMPLLVNRCMSGLRQGLYQNQYLNGASCHGTFNPFKLYHLRKNKAYYVQLHLLSSFTETVSRLYRHHTIGPMFESNNIFINLPTFSVNPYFYGEADSPLEFSNGLNEMYQFNENPILHETKNPDGSTSTTQYAVEAVASIYPSTLPDNVIEQMHILASTEFDNINLLTGEALKQAQIVHRNIVIKQFLEPYEVGKLRVLFTPVLPDHLNLIGCMSDFIVKQGDIVLQMKNNDTWVKIPTDFAVHPI